MEINLQKVKFWGLIILIQISSFTIGYLSRPVDKNAKDTNNFNQSNYNKNQTNEKATNPEPAKANQITKTNLAEDCPIKGNISSKSKVYHLVGGAFYNRTNAETCFNTEAEAQAAGFVKSSR